MQPLSPIIECINKRSTVSSNTNSSHIDSIQLFNHVVSCATWLGGALEAVCKPGRFVVDPQLEPIVKNRLVHRGQLVSHCGAPQVLGRQD